MEFVSTVQDATRLTQYKLAMTNCATVQLAVGGSMIMVGIARWLGTALNVCESVWDSIGTCGPCCASSFVVMSVVGVGSVVRCSCKRRAVESKRLAVVMASIVMSSSGIRGPAAAETADVDV